MSAIEFALIVVVLSAIRAYLAVLLHALISGSSVPFTENVRLR